MNAAPYAVALVAFALVHAVRTPWRIHSQEESAADTLKSRHAKEVEHYKASVETQKSTILKLEEQLKMERDKRTRPEVILEYLPDVSAFQLSNHSDAVALNVTIPRLILGNFFIDWECPPNLSRGGPSRVNICVCSSVTNQPVGEDPTRIAVLAKIIWADLIRAVPERQVPGKTIEVEVDFVISYNNFDGDYFTSNWQLKYNLATRKTSVAPIMDAERPSASTQLRGTTLV